jgi:hypothetical protein
MNNLNPSRKMTARPCADNLLALLLPAVLIPALLMLFLAGGATASAQVVTNTADSGSGSLRSAIANAYNGEVITFAPNLSGATITLHNTLTINTRKGSGLSSVRFLGTIFWFLLSPSALSGFPLACIQVFRLAFALFKLPNPTRATMLWPDRIVSRLNPSTSNFRTNSRRPRLTVGFLA